MYQPSVLFGYILLVVVGTVSLAAAPPCVVDTFESYTKTNTDTSTFDQDECFALRCTVIENDNIFNAIELHGGNSGIIYYIDRKYNESLFDTSIRSIDPDTHTNEYTVNTKARKRINGEAFTCQCGASKSIPITVIDKGFGNCDGVQTRMTGTDEDDNAIGPFTQDARACITLGFPLRIQELEKKYKNLTVSFTKPAACAGLIQLWGEKEDGGAECQLDINSNVQGDTHTFSIVERNTAAYTGGFPNCTDGLAAFDGTIRVMLVSPIDNSTKYEEVRVTSPGLYQIVAGVTEASVTEASVGGGVAACAAALGCIVTCAGLYFWIAKSAGLGATKAGESRRTRTLAVLGVLLVVFLGLLVGAICLIVTDVQDLAIVIIVPLIAILCLVGAIAFLVFSWNHWRLPEPGTEKLEGQVDSRNGLNGKPGSGNGHKQPSNGTVHYDGKEEKLSSGRALPTPRSNVNKSTEGPGTKHINDAVARSKPRGHLEPLNTSHDNRAYEHEPPVSGRRTSTPGSTVSSGGISPKILRD